MEYNDLSVKQKIEVNRKIGELEKDSNGYFRMIDGKKIYQIEEKNFEDQELNLIINRERVMRNFK